MQELGREEREQVQREEQEQVQELGAVDYDEQPPELVGREELAGSPGLASACSEGVLLLS